MATNTHKVEVVKISVKPHPNADRLDVAHIFGFTCCVAKGQFQDGQLAAYIQPDSVVDSTRPEFDFLAGHERIKVKGLRGVISMGLLLPAPERAEEGDDVAKHFGVTHYEPPIPGERCGEVEGGPVGIYAPKYDVESMYRYKHLFREGEAIIATEKIHGANSRFVFAPDEDRMYCGSRGEWKAKNEGNLWWRALEQNPWIEEFCRRFPGDILYGEAFGNVQSLKYGSGPNDVYFRAFDALRNGEWRNWEDWADGLTLFQKVPIVFEGPFDFEQLIKLSDGPSLIPGAKHIREGIVVRPLVERRDEHLGRVHLKLVGNSYLEKDGK
jgi:RNA ligase (TIGR02306 family)